MKKKYMKQQPVPAPQACNFSTGALFNSEAETWFRERRERRKKLKSALRSGVAALGYVLAVIGIAMVILVLGNSFRLSVIDILANSPRLATREWVEERIASDLCPAIAYNTHTIHATNCPLATPLAPVFRGIPIEPMWINASSNIVVTNSQIIWHTNYSTHGIYYSDDKGIYIK